MTRGASQGGHRTLLVMAATVGSTTFGWAVAVRGYPLTVALAAVLLVALVWLAQIRNAPRTVLATDVVTVQQQVQSLAERNDHLAEQAAAAVSRAAAAADLVTQVEERTRASIVADLHDTVTQTLVAAAFATADPEVDREELGDMMRTAEAELRRLMVSASPLRSSASLAVLIEQLMERLAERDNLSVTLDWDLPTDLVIPHPTATAVYRFIGEALRNVVRHAGVDAAAVSLRIEDGELVAEVRDEGSGYDASKTNPGRGLDLLAARCAAVGGAVVTDSEPGVGTTMRLSLSI